MAKESQAHSSKQQRPGQAYALQISLSRKCVSWSTGSVTPGHNAQIKQTACKAHANKQTWQSLTGLLERICAFIAKRGLVQPKASLPLRYCWCVYAHALPTRKVLLKNIRADLCHLKYAQSLPPQLHRLNLLEDLPGLSKEYYNKRDSSHQHSPLAMLLVFHISLPTIHALMI